MAALATTMSAVCTRYYYCHSTVFAHRCARHCTAFLESKVDEKFVPPVMSISYYSSCEELMHILCETNYAAYE